LADTLKFTENGKESRPADAPLWKTAGALKYAHSALDTETCNSATETVVPDGTSEVPVAVRLKLVNRKITEIETIAARKGDYTGVTSNTAALAASKGTIKWEDSVPAATRNTLEDLTNWMSKYFKQFPQGVCNTTSTCKRMEKLRRKLRVQRRRRLRDHELAWQNQREPAWGCRPASLALKFGLS